MTQHRPEDIDWSGMSVEDILEIAIADELAARDYYRNAADLAGDLHTRRLLLDLSVMEQGHADTLRHELDELHLQRDLEAGLAD